MKKISLLVVLLTTSAAFAQLKKVETPVGPPVEEIGKHQTWGAPLEAEITKTGSIYKLKYRDEQFKTMIEYCEFTFEDVDNTFNDLYTAIIEGFNTMPKDPVNLELPDYLISLNYSKSFSSPAVSISAVNKKNGIRHCSSNYMSKKQIDKLFGKKK